MAAEEGAFEYCRQHASPVERDAEFAVISALYELDAAQARSAVAVSWFLDRAFDAAVGAIEAGSRREFLGALRIAERHAQAALQHLAIPSRKRSTSKKSPPPQQQQP